MEAVRCTECGETRWSLFPGTRARALEASCDLCGGPMVVERRRPGSHPGQLPVERRRAEVADRVGGGAHSRVHTR